MTGAPRNLHGFVMPWRHHNEEFQALVKNDTWTLVPPSPNLNIVGNKWIFRIKRGADGSIQRYKARLVTKGYHQHPSVDFFETFSLVAKSSTIRVVLGVAISKQWAIRQLDFNNAFLNGRLDEEVYMTQSPGYVDESKSDYICRLNKAIYGLKQAPRAWNTTVKCALLRCGFVNSRSDTSLFIFRRGKYVLLLLVYVADVILTRNDEQLITELINHFDSQFALKDLGRLNYFLGIQLHYLETGILLNQSKYVDDLLFKVEMSNTNAAPTPSVQGKHLSITDGQPMTNLLLY